MKEIELKFLVPVAKLDAIKRQTHIKSSMTENLAAHYFDTPDQILAKNSIALRIRKEGDDWVQTIKAKGDGLASRIEHNYKLDTQLTNQQIAQNQLKPDLTIYIDTPVEKILKKFDINKLNNHLTCQYITDVDRTTRQIKKQWQAIEVAFDTGKVIHGTDNTQAQPLQEIELELLRGQEAFLFETAKTWCKRYKLNLSTITKAERGNLLLAGKQHPNAVKAALKSLEVHKKMSSAQFMRAVTHNCLLQIMPNASAIAAGSKDGNHVHQLRVGIRRLRTALKFFDGFSQNIQPDWMPVLKQTFSLLGEYRDRDVLKHKTQPMLEDIGSPHVEWSTDIKIMPIDAVQANDFQLTLLELIEFALSDADEEGKSKPAQPRLVKILDKLFNKIATASSHFAELELEAQHDVRKRLKSLRYICEFAAPIYNKKSTKPFIKYLEPAQDVLGDYNDNIVGHEFYLERSKVDAQALFAVGWFLAREQQSAIICADALKTVKNAPKFW